MRCDVLPASSPEIWGPPTWTALHLLAEGYPQRPTPPVRKSCRAFLDALPWMLPCEACGYHFRIFLQAWPGGSRKAASCQEALQCFFVDAHNAVQLHTRPDALPWTRAEAQAFYSSGCGTSREAAPLLWSGTSLLVRAIATPPAAGSAHTERASGAPTCSCSRGARRDKKDTHHDGAIMDAAAGQAASSTQAEGVRAKKP